MSNPQTASSKTSSPSPSTTHPRITIVGYGEGAGREHARRLREHGHDVSVAMLPGGMSWVHARADGFRPTRVQPAVVGADVIVVLVPLEEVELLYWEEIAPVAPAGAMVIFGDAVELDADRLPKGVDVVVITMRADGSAVAVVADATGHAHDRAVSYLQALGGNVPRPASSRFRIVDDADPFPHPSRRVL